LPFKLRQAVGTQLGHACPCGNACVAARALPYEPFLNLAKHLGLQSNG